MGKRKPKQNALFFSAQEIPQAASHPFYTKVNDVQPTNKVATAWSTCASVFTSRSWVDRVWLRVCISGCSCSATLKESIRNGELRGV